MYREGGLRHLGDMKPAELEAVIQSLVEKKLLRADAFNAEVDELRAKQNERAAQILEAEARFELLPEQRTALFSKLKARFKNNQRRHKLFLWRNVEAKLNQVPAKKLWSLWRMEETGGEPDVVDYDRKTGEYIFYDCSLESPEGRRNLVYDKEAEEWLKTNRPDEKCNGNAVDMAAEMGVDILDATQYQYLQEVGDFDRKTWSWVKTPVDRRKAGVALYGARTDDVVYVYVNLADNHADSGGFRGSLRV